jgi:F-type H+-transporting ATPase subunit b
MNINWWTLGLQVVNVLILIWLLARFFFRPIAGIIAERQQQTAAALSEAADARKAADAARTDAESLRRQFADEHDKILADARAAGEAARGALVKQAAGDIAAMKTSAEETIAKERAAVAAETIDRAGTLAVDIAAKLVAELPDRHDGAFLEKLCAEIDRLPADLRKGLTATDGAETPEIVSAVPLSDAEASECRRRIAGTLGADLPLRFRVDPALLAGVELHGPHTIVRASWRGDLDHILTDLKHDADRQ